MENTAAITFRVGALIILDGLYGCSHADCSHTVWGTSGRRFLRLPCGHEAAYRLIRRRMDNLL